MPKVSYSDKEREYIRQSLLETGLQFIAKQGVQHTTIEQIYKKVGISRTFFYTFFSSKEDLVVESLYFQQPKILEYITTLVNDNSLSWREALTTFLETCCYGNGIVVLTIEEQQMIFKRLSSESYALFRRKQEHLFEDILRYFGIKPSKERVQLFINLSLMLIIFQKAIPTSLPLLIPEAAKETVDFQIKTIVNYRESMKQQ